MSEVRTGAQRTGTPLVVGYVIGALIEQGINMTGNTQVIVTLAASWLFYVVVRFLEVNTSPKWSYVLGSSQTAVFATPPAMVTDEDGQVEVVEDGARRVE